MRRRELIKRQMDLHEKISRTSDYKLHLIMEALLDIRELLEKREESRK